MIYSYLKEPRYKKTSMDLINNFATTGKKKSGPADPEKKHTLKRNAFCGKHKNITIAIFSLKILRIRISE